jgi:hypothetical protein
MTEVFEESFSLDSFESSVIVRCGYSSCESCLRGKTKGEFLTVQKLNKQLICSSSCPLSMEMISDAV